MRTFPTLSPKANRYGSYEIRWSELENGEWRSKRKSTKTSDKAEAEAALARFLTIRDAEASKQSKTVAEVVEFYLRHHSLPRGNEMTDRRCLRAPLEAFAKWPAHSIRDDAIDAYTMRRSSGSYGPKKVAGLGLPRS